MGLPGAELCPESQRDALPVSVPEGTATRGKAKRISSEPLEQTRATADRKRQATASSRDRQDATLRRTSSNPYRQRLGRRSPCRPLVFGVRLCSGPQRRIVIF